MKKGFNEYSIDGDIVTIYIKDFKIKIDLVNLEKVNKYRWYISSKPEYPYADIWDYDIKKSKRIRMHQLLMGKKDGYIIDHINGDKNDNTINNLRFCTYSQNGVNKIRGKGYTLLKYNKKTCRGRKMYLIQYAENGKMKSKRFLTERDAIIFKVTYIEKSEGFCRYRQMYKHYFTV